MLINGVDMKIKLTRAPEAFYLLAPSDDNKDFRRYSFHRSGAIKTPSATCSR